MLCEVQAFGFSAGLFKPRFIRELLFKMDVLYLFMDITIQISQCYGDELSRTYLVYITLIVFKSQNS